MDQELKPYIFNNPDFIVFGTPYCKFCKKAKKLLEQKEQKFNYIDLENEPDVLLKDKLLEKNNFKTIPIVYVRIGYEIYKFLGGFSELEIYLKM
jgi:glutaredoxin